MLLNNKCLSWFNVDRLFRISKGIVDPKDGELWSSENGDNINLLHHNERE